MKIVSMILCKVERIRFDTCSRYFSNVKSLLMCLYFLENVLEAFDIKIGELESRFHFSSFNIRYVPFKFAKILIWIRRKYYDQHICFRNVKLKWVQESKKFKKYLELFQKINIWKQKVLSILKFWNLKIINQSLVQDIFSYKSKVQILFKNF